MPLLVLFCTPIYSRLTFMRYPTGFRALFRYSSTLLGALLFQGAFLFTLAGCGAPPPAQDIASDRAAIEQLLNDQVAAWNAGDIPAFMEGYWKSDSLRFASGNAMQQGWQMTLERYQRSYPDRQTMGTLTFTLEDVRVLSPQWATVFGRFHLARDPAIGDATGLFTLMFRKFPDGWKIVSDHTSS